VYLELKQHSYQLKKLHHSPLEQLSAAFDILNITYSSYTNKLKLRKNELPAYCPAYSAALLFDSLQKLIAAQLLVCTQKGRLLPNGPEEKLQYREIVASILGDSFPETEGGKAASELFQQIKPVLSNNYSEKTSFP